MKFCAEVDLKVIWVVQHIQETASFFEFRNAERAKENMLLERCIWTPTGYVKLYRTTYLIWESTKTKKP